MVTTVFGDPSPHDHVNTADWLQLLLYPRTDVLTNEIAELTHAGTGVAVKEAWGPVYTRTGVIVATELSQLLVAIIVKVYAPPDSQEDPVYE